MKTRDEGSPSNVIECNLTERIEASFAWQGFDDRREFTWPDGRVVWYSTPGNPESYAQWLPMNNGVVACVGSLFLDGKTGAQALSLLWNRFAGPRTLIAENLLGNYVVFLFKNGRAWLFADPLGMVKIYRAPSAHMFSTSWLACVQACDAPRLDRIGALDFVMSGANHGERTPVRQVSIADPACIFDPTTGNGAVLTPPESWMAAELYRDSAKALVDCASTLTAIAKVLGSCFAGKVNSALSGGFDSRLILAAMRSAGCTPLLHVYGRREDEDVLIADGIARMLGMTIHHIDKTSINENQPEIDESCLDRNLAFFDGIPTDGIFDRGADAQTRILQSAQGAIALNGGGGEILRNFFYLKDRPYSAAEVFQVFYSNFPNSSVVRPLDRTDYRDYMVDSMEHQVGRSGRLPREIVELLYPLFRARFWTSRNNSLAARCGHFMTPLLDPRMVRIAARLPLAWKDYGRFEAKLLTKLCPELGRFGLTYGFAPADGPSRAYRQKMWLQHRRPPWMRAATHEIRRWLPPRTFTEPLRMPEFEGCDSMLDLVLPARLVEADQVARLMNLRYAAHRLGIVS